MIQTVEVLLHVSFNINSLLIDYELVEIDFHDSKIDINYFT